ncbi:hypothetical protein [Amycolatopsis cihanbeyliensis]|uniref:DUF7847 domain-containing protein n=1 Tax=Amycolatopsis cihanbeyliensis TaxID=1128664 RepID=A0A542DPM5_AMYCI|nr:hypothetical protein [Amycolatopsis cihanbeyliensis]TQJ04915.1 hypothetical protein FB471_4725 [Amycolatopsis cihanbeyliensis]
MTDSGGWSRPDPDKDPNDVPPEQGLPHAPPPRGGWGQGQGHGKPGVIPLRPLGLGEILDGSITTMRRHPALMLGAAAAVGAVVQFISVLISWSLLRDALQSDILFNPNALTEDEVMSLLGRSAASAGLSIAVALVAQTFLTGFLTVVVGRAVLGRQAGLRDTVAEVVPRLLPLLGLTILFGLISFSGVLVGGVLFALTGASGLLFLLAGILASVWLYVRFSLATPALVLERGRVIPSLGRSALLVRGSWWRIFGILLVAYLIGMLISLVVGVPFGAVSGASIGFGDLLLTALGSTIAGAVTYPFTAGVNALVYIDRRMRVEGMDIELARAASEPPPEGPAPQS